MALSVSVATGAYGVSFGALAVAAGLDVWQAMVLSLLMYTGGSQFAFVGAAVLVGLRNAVYVTQVNSWFHPRGAQRILMAHITTDESTAVAAAIAAAAVTVALVPMLPAGISPPGMRGRVDVGLGAGRVAGVFRDQTGGPAGAASSPRR